MRKLKRIKNNISKLLNYQFEEKFTNVNNKIDYEHDKIIRNIDDLNRKFDELDRKLNNLYDEKLDYIIKNFSYNSIEINNPNLYENNGLKKVLICGFYGAHNYGDELMLNVIMNELKKFNNLDITIMLCDKYNIDINKYGKCKFVHYPTCVYDLNSLANNYDCLIFGGGALIDDYEYDLNDATKQLSLGYILVNLTMRFITFEKTTILYGLSSNDKLTNNEFISKLSYVIENASYVSFRDTYSIELLRKLGMNVNNIKLVDDLVFCYDYKYQMKTNNLKVKNIGIIYNCYEENKKYIYDETKKLIEYLNKKKIKYNLNFIVFYSNHDNDYNFYKNLILDLNIKNCDIINNNYKFDIVKSTILENDIIITMRYHGSLISNMLGIPTITLLNKNHRHYVNKMTYLHERYNFRSNLVEQLDTKLLDDIIDLKKINPDDKITNIAKNQLKELDQYLKKNE